MADNDALRRMLGEAESHVISLVSAPGPERTRLVLRRRTRRRAVAAALAVTLAVVGIGLSAWSSDPLPPTDPVPTAEPSDSPTPTPSSGVVVEVPGATSTPSASKCLPPIKSLQISTQLDGLNYLRVSYKIADDQTFCGNDLIDTFVVNTQRQGNIWKIEGAAAVTFHQPGMTNGWGLPPEDWCGDDKEVWIFIGLAGGGIPQTWSTSKSPPVPLWAPGRPTGAIKIQERPEGCTQPTQPQTPSPSP